MQTKIKKRETDLPRPIVAPLLDEILSAVEELLLDRVGHLLGIHALDPPPHLVIKILLHRLPLRLAQLLIQIIELRHLILSRLLTLPNLAELAILLCKLLLQSFNMRKHG